MLWLNNLRTRTAMNAKFSVFVICVGAIIYFFYYIICMTVPLMSIVHAITLCKFQRKYCFDNNLQLPCKHMVSEYRQVAVGNSPS